MTDDEKGTSWRQDDGSNKEGISRHHSFTGIVLRFYNPKLKVFAACFSIYRLHFDWLYANDLPYRLEIRQSLSVVTSLRHHGHRNNAKAVSFPGQIKP